MRVVLDTNVIFEGLTKQAGACGLIIEAWRAGLLTVCATNAILAEYEDVLSRKLSAQRWTEITIVLDELLEVHTEFIQVYFVWRPISPDPGDDHVIECAMNANASVVTSNLRDFRIAENKLGVSVITPLQLIRLLTEM